MVNQTWICCGYAAYFKRTLNHDLALLNASNEDEPSSLIHDRYAIACKDKNGTTVGHVPKYVSKQIHFFIKYDERVEMKVNGKRRYSNDLQHGRLEIPNIFSE